MGFWSHFNGIFIGEFHTYEKRDDDKVYPKYMEGAYHSSTNRWDEIFGAPVSEFYKRHKDPYPDDFWDSKATSEWGAPKWLPHGEGNMVIQIHKLTHKEYLRLYDYDKDPMFRTNRAKHPVFIVTFWYSDEGMSRDEIQLVFNWWKKVTDDFMTNVRYSYIKMEDDFEITDRSTQTPKFVRMTHERLVEYSETMSVDSDYIYK